MSMIERLDSEIKEVCPIHGIGPAPGNLEIGPGSVRVDFVAGATPDQINAAQTLLANFDWSNQAQNDWEEARKPERKSFRDAVQQALDDNNEFLAQGASPTVAQVVAQVRRLTVQNNKIIQWLSRLE